MSPADEPTRFPFLALVRDARQPGADLAALAERAERELLPLRAYLDTWGAPCTGKRAAQRERLLQLLVDCALYQLGRPAPASAEP